MKIIFNLLLFAGGPGTFNHDLLYIELGLIAIFLLLAYGKKIYLFVRDYLVHVWHRLYNRSTSSDIGHTE